MSEGIPGDDMAENGARDSRVGVDADVRTAPCPFCGERNDFGIGRGTEDREGFPTWMYCGTCGAQGPWIYTRDKANWTCTAIAAANTGWNGRAS